MHRLSLWLLCYTLHSSCLEQKEIKEETRMSHGIYAHIKYIMHINKTCRKDLNQILQEQVFISQCSTHWQAEKSSILGKLLSQSQQNNFNCMGSQVRTST